MRSATACSAEPSTNDSTVAHGAASFSVTVTGASRTNAPTVGVAPSSVRVAFVPRLSVPATRTAAAPKTMPCVREPPGAVSTSPPKAPSEGARRRVTPSPRRMPEKPEAAPDTATSREAWPPEVCAVARTVPSPRRAPANVTLEPQVAAWQNSAPSATASDWKVRFA